MPTAGFRRGMDKRHHLFCNHNRFTSYSNTGTPSFRKTIDADPFSYPFSSAALRHRPNRRVLEELIEHVLKQGIITQPVTVDELFAPSTLNLVG